MTVNMLKTRTVGLLAASLLLSSAVGLARHAGTEGPVAPKKAEALTATTFVQYQKQIKPQPGESRWMEIPWFTDLHGARQKAAAEGKPLFIYASGGSVSIGSC